jgi:hypothetical protein
MSNLLVENRCAICQVEFEEGESALLLPCKHLYHKPCIDPWLAENKVRTPVVSQKYYGILLWDFN